ncbi:Fibronectin type-III domain-containing protein C4orf31 [Harpegnathos saltator]|uniref:Fibronectin type-III domain-containing protein C4orf31 n=1 Tax=Harpegnathos saltator TaxID=610380 RepID=E2BZN7_HARSA|nr:Fibronectin type-III domain-containing protein C4orf31 [Harpegnathos saltator]
MIGILMILVSIARGCSGCPFCARQLLQQLQQQQQQSQQQQQQERQEQEQEQEQEQHQHQQQQHQQQQEPYRSIGSLRPFGADRPTRVQEFNRTGVLHPEYQIPATIRPGNVSQFYYLSPREGPPLTLLVSPCSGPISWTVSYVEPPENDQEAEGIKSQTRWPVKTLKPGSPLFTYEGADDQNFTIPKTRAGLYWFEIKSVDPATDNGDSTSRSSPGTVLLYATSSSLDHVPGIYANDKEHRHRSLRFQQRRSKRRLTVSWNKSHVDPHLSNYCLAVTSGTQPQPSTLCAARDVLKAHPHTTRTGSSSKEHHHRGHPEGLHCVRQTKLTLHRMRYDATYNFTLYVVNTRNNVSNRVAVDSIRFKKPELTLRTGRYTTANLRKTDGFVNFRYRPPDNTSSIFHILPCGGGIVKAKLSGPEVLREKEVVGYASLRVPPLPPGKTYTLRISTTPQELVRVSTIKVLATQESSTIYPQIPTKNPPREYRSLRTCHEVTIGVEPAGAAKYCILVKELRSSSSLASVTTVPDQCGLHRRRRSEYTFEVCKEQRDPPKDRALPFTLTRLQPGKAYLLQITAQLKGQSLSYPLLGVRTRRFCDT